MLQSLLRGKKPLKFGNSTLLKLFEPGNLLLLTEFKYFAMKIFIEIDQAGKCK